MKRHRTSFAKARPDARARGRARFAATLAVTCPLLALACSRPPERDFRGTSTPSADGQTQLIVVVSGSQPCTPWLDGRPWSRASGAPGPVGPGTHTVSCAGDRDGLSFVVHEGATFRFELVAR